MLQLKNDRGFTLVEILAVLIIFGIILGVVVSKFNIFNNSARRTATIITVQELNTREKMIWSNIKLSDDGYVDDQSLITLVDYDLGQLKWSTDPTVTGGIVATGGGDVALIRVASTRSKPAQWSE